MKAIILKNCLCRSLFLIFFGIGFISCSEETENEVPTPPIYDESPNILLIIADDLGKDALNGYSEGNIKSNTPNLDGIRNSGLTFTNFWVNPTCTPTRSSIITGKYGYRTNVKWASDPLSRSETTLQTYINQQTNAKYATAIVGKWHLSGNNSSINPETFGIDYYAGLIRGAVDDYYQWQLSEDGSTKVEESYVTEKFTDLAIEWVNQQEKPWFLWLAYNAPHTPFHVPPSEMHTQGNLTAYTDDKNPTPYYMASIEAMDYQIGKLLSQIPADEKENTVIIFMGDNGSPAQVAQAPYSRSKSKGSLYQGGINVPMFVSGIGVNRMGQDNNLLIATDLFATIAELTGINLPEIYDSKSFKTLFSSDTKIRDFQYSEMDDGTNDLWTISNGTYKLLVNANGEQQLYNLADDPYENDDLFQKTLTSDTENAKTELETELANIRN